MKQLIPKDKAKDLFVKHLESIPDSLIQNNEDASMLAKCNALVTVNEVIQDIPMYLGNLNPKYVYWNEVKQELLILNNEDYNIQ
ncbi:hypothetical protein U9K52_08630 [Chryseobacterium sp. MHB01]|uniref:hypothetical protein n=1 Tax=Chryseobacterium sp. MHB01 TaxID=3109433 RepID=UPI002AFEDFB5|nr:hypothetical protein [Chryseobacterium sp. MHB01]MEA1848972.1 hypothetical protein [Chryseobacterium sp. MHB01]